MVQPIDRVFSSRKKEDEFLPFSSFIGNEIETSKAFGMKTLFIECKNFHQMLGEILKYGPTVTHVYLNANHTDIDKISSEELKSLLDLLDSMWNIRYYTIELYNGDLDGWTYGFKKREKLLFNVSIRIPGAEEFQDRISIKIDDVSMQFPSNRGVWTHPLSDFLGEDSLTTWDEYEDDVPNEFKRP